MTDALAMDLERLAADVQRRGRLPSVVLAAAQRGELVGATTARAPTVGIAPDEGTLTSDDAPAALPYRIGSITKTFTAAVVLRLAERGDLELDAPVRTYLPDTGFGRVPLRALLAHCGGLPREAPVDMWATMRGPDEPSLAAALREVEPVDDPGTRWHYSNLGYAVLGQVVARATGLGCADLIDSELLAPLNLSNTTWNRPGEAVVGYRVDPYADLLHTEPDMDQAAIGVAGQLWSTAPDLLRWGHALAGGAPHVLSERVVEAMHTVHVMVDRSNWTTAWGLGLILDRRGDRLLAGHTGAMPGFTSALSIDRDTHTVVVALTNATRGSTIGPLAAEAMELVLQAAPPPAALPWQPSDPYPAELDGVLGRWWSESDETVLTWRDNALHTHLASTPDTSETRLAREDADLYRGVAGRMRGERLHIHRDPEGHVTHLVWATYPMTRSPR